MSAETIFAEAAGKAAADRAGYLDAACGGDARLRQRVERLLAAHDAAGNFLEEPAVERAGGTIDEVPIPEQPGARVGPYKLMEQIGEGGFGLVFVAEQQEPVRRKVALKVIKPGMDSRQVIARFEAERQALALMDHPNIAKVLDAGATESGRPYFVMELVRGIPITDYCDQNQLPPRERLDLFVTVCQAIQHAHQKGIIHRDIKPSNVLVTSHDGKPVAKVIDFGVAKAIHQHLTERTLYTNFAQMIGTPLYMSPEQAEMSGLDIDTRSDIYSLGVLLYELLTGTTPLEKKQFAAAAYDEIRRLIREEEPPKPSTRLSSSGSIASLAAQRKMEPAKLSKLVRGDLDWITMKALEKDRTRRYETANGLARDVQRYLNDEPVEACPPSATYQVRKFIRRHRRFIDVAAAMAILIACGVFGTVYGLIKSLDAEFKAKNEAVIAQQERDRAVTAEKEAKESKNRADGEAAKATAVNDFLQNDLLRQAGSRFQADRRFAPDPNLTVRDALDRAAAKVGEKFKDRPEVEASVRQSVGNAYWEIGIFDKAIDHLRRSCDLHRRLLGPEHPDTLEAENDLADAYQSGERVDEAIALAEKVADARTKLYGRDHPTTLVTLNVLAIAYARASRHNDAIALNEWIRDCRVKQLGEDDPATLITLNNLAMTYEEVDRNEEAIRLLLRAHDLSVKRLGPDHPNTLLSVNMLGFAYLNVKPDEALATFERVRDAQARILGPDHPDTLRSVDGVARAYLLAGKYSEAIDSLQPAIAAAVRRLGPDHPVTLLLKNTLGAAYDGAGKRDLAIQLLLELRDAHSRLYGPNHRSTLNNLNNLAAAYANAGRPADAIPLLQQVLAAQSENADERMTAKTHLAYALRGVGRLDEAIVLWEEAYPARARLLGFHHPSTASVAYSFAEAYRDKKQFDRAIALLEQTLARQREKFGAEHPLTGPTLIHLGVTYRAAGRLPEAVATLETARRISRGGDNFIWAGRELMGTYFLTKNDDAAADMVTEMMAYDRKKSPVPTPKSAGDWVGIGAKLLPMKRYAVAEAVLRQCLADREKLAAEGKVPAWQVANARSLLGDALLGQKKYAEAEPLLLAGYDGLVKASDRDVAGGAARASPASLAEILNARRAEAAQRLVRYYEATGKPEEAANWLDAMWSWAEAAPAANP